jgi:DNA-binding CsgD family transcriptional regulator
VAGLQGTARRALVQARLRRGARKSILPLDPATLRVLVAHVAALLGTAAVLLAGTEEAQLGAALGLAMFVGIASLRVASVRRSLAVSTLILDAAGTALFVAGTHAPSSVYYFLAIAGAWWAAHVRRRHSGSMWAGTFVVVYALLVLAPAVEDRMLIHALEDVAVVVIIGVLSDWFVRVDARAIALSEALAQAPAGAEKLAIRDGLTRALGPMEISIDVLLAASRAGLTVVQAELLAYLVLGLTNQEIADATKVGVPTVRYRLTRLYRALGVSGRKAAIAAARELGLSASLD